ncbi:SDA1 domain containing 1 [Phyllostomus discolor]|uniref:SDA1 domain containing 1 n=1 Tax=Phyllostomus discolor TaxID=89673 RepID=A0A834ETJ0_9CHIR|nr:SDA1 domain containing 1 [Phyllostomus discolor]
MKRRSRTVTQNPRMKDQQHETCWCSMPQGRRAPSTRRGWRRL